MFLEAVLMWSALSVFMVSTAVFVIGVVFGRDIFVRTGVATIVVAIAFMTVSFGLRWMRVGHGPYLGYYEVASTQVYFAALAFAIGAWRFPRIAPAGAAISPFSLLILGTAMFSPQGGNALTPTLSSWWLILHVLFAKLASGFFIVGFALAAAYLLRERARSRMEQGERRPWELILDRLPDQPVLEDMLSRFLAVGFIFWGIMIASGAIWANEAWGRYWGWDPIETWSLIVWLIYALFLHLRLTMGWRGTRIAGYAVAAMPVAVFCVIGIPFVSESIHAAYISGTLPSP